MLGLDSLVVVAGAAITVGWTAVTGLKIERWAQRHLPGAPRDVGAPVGLLVGLATVAWWLRP